MERWMRAVWLVAAMTVCAWGAGAEAFRRMSPTVRVVSYRRTYTDEIVAESSGSGTVITSDGLVLTNHHVIYDAAEQRAYDTFEIGITFDLRRRPVRKYTARLVALDKGLDLALLAINPADVWGRELPRLEHLDWDARVSPREGQSVQVFGYPASGGETLTVTRGQISGFEGLNEYTCFKTDTDIDHGSSGGTVLGRRKRLIGVPVYLRSYAENVGYILDIREARPWISAHLADVPVVDEVAEQRLIFELDRYVRANQTHSLRLETYPRLSIEVPEDWRFETLGKALVVIVQERVADPAAIVFHLDRRPFAIDDGFIATLKEDVRRNQDQYADVEEVDTTFSGAPAWQLTTRAEGARRVVVHAFVGSALLRVFYQLDEDAGSSQEEAVEAALAGVTFIDGSDIPPPAPRRRFAFVEPAVELELPEGWGGRPNDGSDSSDVMLRAWQRGNHRGVVVLTYQRLPKAVQQLPISERLRQVVDGLIGRDVVDKQADILVDGLPGYLLATDMAGDTANDVRRALLVVIDTGEHDLVVEYGDAVETFDENVDGMMAMLESIRVETAHREGARVTRIGTFGLRFSDVQHHRFATEIMFLASRDLLQGYTSEHFGPEDPVTRAQALRLAVDSWNRFQDEQAGDRRIAVAEVPPAAASASGAAAVPSWCSAYVAAARERGLSWVGSDVFAGAASVTLVEGLRLLLEIYDIPLWQGSGGRLWKPVMDKGYELHLIPRGLADRNQRLTNAEMAALVQAMYVQMQIR